MSQKSPLKQLKKKKIKPWIIKGVIFKENKNNNEYYFVVVVVIHLMQKNFVLFCNIERALLLSLSN